MNTERAKIMVRGAVQGVGFRPFVYRLATALGLHGSVLNSAGGVLIEVEGPPSVLEEFLVRLQKEKPAHAIIHSLERSTLDPVGYQEFQIHLSDQAGAKTALILPDIATCADCLAEVFDPGNRRYLYPFTNCTNCGPRFSIIEALPYDRPNTSMKAFAMCPECAREYHDPADRRFDAQPNACPRCGPHLELWDSTGNSLAKHHQALVEAAAAVRSGKVLALKGLGGFQLIVDARNEGAVQRMREHKHREEKPFALMMPSLGATKDLCEVCELEERVLVSGEAPIVLLRRRAVGAPQNGSAIAPSVAPWNPNLGVMLPYTPLHHLLMGELSFPIVATSGNLSDEPICTDEREAVERLHGIGDFFLVHNRPIVRHVDDSVVRVMLGREMVLRRARGYAPLPVHLKEPLPSILAVGAHLKNAVALSVEREVFISQHIGDLETRQAYTAFCKVTEDLQQLYGATPELVVCDLHPEYLSTKFAQELVLRGRSPEEPQRPVSGPIKVQHHYAHVVACMAENELAAPVLGVSWDGTGYGLDATIWGGEFLRVDATSFTRVGHFRQFRLPGGEAAIKQPRRTALGVLYQMLGESVFLRQDLLPIRNFTEDELGVLRQMLGKGVQSPVTSSAGRLFDAVASLVGLRQRVSFEGQAAMELELSLSEGIDGRYPLELEGQAPFIVNWEPMISQILQDVHQGQTIGLISAKFHNTLAEGVVQAARKVGEPKVVLTGGCFQNRYLTERTVHRLREEGFRPYWHQRVPPNDGGIALGQVLAAARAGLPTAKVEEMVAR
jgi:hydrogenase maturation protein HypF